MSLHLVKSGIRAELLKLRTTTTTLWTLGSMLAVIGLGSFVHFAGFEISFVDDIDEQLRTLTNIGVQMGLIFAAISGASSITSEFRYGTIRPVLTKQPHRSALIISKAATQAVVGAAIGSIAAIYATVLAELILRSRDASVVLSSDQVIRLLVSGLIGGAAFALLGLAIGVVARNQAGVAIGILVWVLFVESLLRAGVPSIARFSPGSLGRAIAAQDIGQLTSPMSAAIALIALTLFTVVTAMATFSNRDIA